MLYTSLMIFVGGGLGSLFRFGISKFGQSLVATKLPIGTILVNTIACFLLGIIV